MVDIELANRLVSALTPKTRLVIVGDADQLPSIGPGDVLNDLIKSDYFKLLIFTIFIVRKKDQLL